MQVAIRTTTPSSLPAGHSISPLAPPLLPGWGCRY